MDAIGSLDVRWAQGFTNKNIDFVDSKTVCYPCGNHIRFLNLVTKAQSVFQAPGRGVGVLTAKGSSGIFAFSEQKLSPSIFVYTFPELQLKNELKGTAKLDYTCLTLSDEGPYLGCCSSLPDHIITVWNWETAEPICTQPEAGHNVVSLMFNPLNWLQLCALGTTFVTVWNIERCASYHVLKSSEISLPVMDGSLEGNQGSTTLHLSPSDFPLSTQNDSFMLTTKARLTPSAICWTATSKLYVGCVEGFLLLVDPDSVTVSILFNPTTTDANPELRNSTFNSLTLNNNSLITIGKDSVMHCLQVKENRIDITQTWQIEKPDSTVMCSPDGETLLLSSSTGQIYTMNPTQSDKAEKVLDVFCGNFVTAAFLHKDGNICVSLRESGELQLWSLDGFLLSSLSLQTEVTSLACCPIAHCVAVGTASGSVLFIDLTEEQRPRLVHQVDLYHTAVAHLVFDQEGHFLLSSASDSNLYVLDARPSKAFEVIGYKDLPGRIVCLSTRCNRESEEVKVLALCAGEEDKNHNGSLLTVLLLPTNLEDGVDRHGCLFSGLLKMCRYKVPHPLKSCVLGVNNVFAYCHRKKNLQRFLLPQENPSSQDIVQLTPEQEVRAHQLGPAVLTLSPHSLWLASVGRDGLLRIRETSSMERYIELQSHSYRFDGGRSVSFSADSLTLLTTGFKDDSLVCTNLRIKPVNPYKMKKASEYSQLMADFLKVTLDTENQILTGFPEWHYKFSGGHEKPNESEVSVGTSAEATKQEGSYNSVPCAPLSHQTWLDKRRQAVIKEDNEQHLETKTKLRKTIKELRDSIQEIIRDSDDLPEQHYNLDVEEQKRLEAEVEEEVAKVRAEIEQDILEKQYLRDVLKRDCWDSMKVKGRAIRAFYSDEEVQNYPLKERTKEELENLRRVENMRKREKAACAQNELKSPTAQAEEHGEDGHDVKSSSLMGSFSAELGYSNPYTYNQFSLQTAEQRVNQIILLQDVIYRIKTAFNADFEVLHRQKVQELKRVKDRNRHIRDLMLELDMKEELWERSLADSEWPERLFTVDDTEIKAEKYLTPEQKKEEEKRKLEELNRLAAQDNDSRERPLIDMMDGVLEVKKDDILKMEIPQPEFALTKPDIQWSEEEKKVYKEYEKKAKDLDEEKEKYKKSLEAEIKKLQESTKEATKKFDETLTKLFERKMKCTEAIYQEELKISNLVGSIAKSEEMRNQELEIKLKLEKLMVHKDEMGEVVKRHEEEVELFHKVYDNSVAEDKIIDAEFRKHFSDIPTQVVDLLYKLFKRRPRVQKMRAQTENQNLLEDRRHCDSMAPDALSKLLKAVEDLDAPENMPEVLNPSQWERFCLVRRGKVESEHQVKLKALSLAEMQAFLQRRKDEEKAVQQEIKSLTEALESLHRERNKLHIDTMVQVILKQGQVEVPTVELNADNNNFILCVRSVVDDLRQVIRMLGEKKIASMEKRKNVRKEIIQLEWEHRVLRKKIEDLNDKARSIKMLRLPEEEEDTTTLGKTSYNSHISKQTAMLERSLALMEKTHLQIVQQRRNTIKRINRKAALKAKDSATLEQELHKEELVVSQLKHICENTASEEMEIAKREERLQEVFQKSKLEEVARAQMQELAFLWAEVERLTKRNFPSLDQLKYN